MLYVVGILLHHPGKLGEIGVGTVEEFAPGGHGGIEPLQPVHRAFRRADRVERGAVSPVEFLKHGLGQRLDRVGLAEEGGFAVESCVFSRPGIGLAHRPQDWRAC